MCGARRDDLWAMCRQAIGGVTEKKAQLEWIADGRCAEKHNLARFFERPVCQTCACAGIPAAESPAEDTSSETTDRLIAPQPCSLPNGWICSVAQLIVCRRCARSSWATTPISDSNASRELLGIAVTSIAKASVGRRTNVDLRDLSRHGTRQSI
jgi:hypothetical protein